MTELIDLVSEVKKSSNVKILKLLTKFEPLLLTESPWSVQLDPNCLQELREHFVEHIYRFEIRCQCNK